MNKVRFLDRVFCLVAAVICVAMVFGMSFECEAASSIYKGNSLRITVKGLDPVGQPVPYGTDVKGVYFDGYPQIVKKEGSKPIYNVRVEKDIWVTLRDGVRIAVDVYRPDVGGSNKYPVIMSYANWGKEMQEMIRWLPRQAYNPDTPFWDGCLEAGNINYVVARGYVHVIPEPRNIGKSEGTSVGGPKDIYDIIDWIVKQPWCNGNVGMMGACAFAGNQMQAAALEPHPNLKAINPFELLSHYVNSDFHGVFDCASMAVRTGRHGNDSSVQPNVPYTSRMLKLPKEELDRRLQEALNHPDFKYNSKWYCLLKYPNKMPRMFDQILEYFHPTPRERFPVHKIKIPAYLSCTWSWRLYIWGTFDAWENMETTPNKKLMLWPPGSPDRPYVQYIDETVRWHDYWLKGIDTGILDEPPIKMFVMGINKWKFENEWPLARTKYTKYYLHPKGSLTKAPPQPGGEPDTFVQPALCLDPTVYCLRYSTGPLLEDLEVTGRVALYLEASIDKDDTNWMVDLVDVDPVGNRQLISIGHLKAAHRALDRDRSKPYYPVHPRQEPVPVPPGEVIEYAITLMPTATVFQKGHSMELIIRNQDDLLSTQGIWGIYYLPFMQTVTHNIHFGKSHLLLPVIPSE